MKKVILSISLIWIFLTCVGNLGTGTNSESMGGTNDETIIRTGAIIYEQDGTTPAKGATVKVFKIDAIDGKYIALQITDSEGRFKLQDLEPGIFNIWVEKDSMVAFQDSVCISINSTTVHNDTLDCASSLTGFTLLQPLYDPRSVTIHVIGTDKYLKHIDSTGHFTLKGMAGGTYSLLLKSALPDYEPTTQLVSVRNCTSDTLKDTIRLVDSRMVTLISMLQAVSNSTSAKKFTMNNIQQHSSISNNYYKSLYRSLHSIIVQDDNCFMNISMEYKKSP